MASDTKMTYPEDPSFDSPQQDGTVDMPQDEVDAIIRNKRKARDPKACYACHRRKVKCDRGLPCDSCIKRDHPELCSYERPGKRRRIALSHPISTPNDQGQLDTSMPITYNGGASVTVPKDHWDRINQELQELRNKIGAHGTTMVEDPARDHFHVVDDGGPVPSDESEREGIHAPSEQMGTMHLGSRSVLAYMMSLGRSQSTQDTAKTLLEENILPKLGLDNETATYPFVDLWSTDSSIQDVAGLCKALPEDFLCRESV